MNVVFETRLTKQGAIRVLFAHRIQESFVHLGLLDRRVGAGHPWAETVAHAVLAVIATVIAELTAAAGKTRAGATENENDDAYGEKDRGRLRVNYGWGRGLGSVG